MKWQRFWVGVSCAFVLTLTGCSFRIPILVPNDTNVLEYAKDVRSDISDVTVRLEGTVAYGKEESGVLYKYQGKCYGSLSDVLYSDVKCQKHLLESNVPDVWSVSSKLSDEIAVSDDSETLDEMWYLDTNSNMYYEKQTGSDWVGYENGQDFVDVNWWMSLLDNTSFKYDGETKDSRNDTVYLLNAVYSGDDIVSVFEHLGLPLNIVADTSDLCLNLYVDRWSGLPTELRILLSNTSSQIFVSTDGGACGLTVFDFRLLFDMESVDVSLPSDFVDLEMQESDGNLSNKTSVVKQDSALVFDDMYVSVTVNDVFDTVSYDENRIDVSSSVDLDGQPIMTVTIIDGEDAYVRAVSDKNSVLDFYQKQGLSELYVSDDMLQCLVAGQVSFIYETQYTDCEYAYVCQEYFAYIELGDNVFAKVSIRSLTDQGESVVLTDSYVDAMLSQITIGKEGVVS